MDTTHITFRVKRYDPKVKRYYTKVKRYDPKVKRYDPRNGIDEFSTYDVPLVPGMTVLEALWHIVDNIDGSLSFRYSCRGAVCGSCAVMINRTITLACHMQVSDLLPGPVTVEPLPYFDVIKDLVVDMEPFLEKYRSVHPYLETDLQPDGELRQTPDERKHIEHSVNCILCAACHAACPLTTMDDTYPGPATLTAAQRFSFDSRNEAGPGELLKIGNLGEFGGCMKIARCSLVCPKGIEPSERTDEVRRWVTANTPAAGEQSVVSVCGYCSVGCGLAVHVKDGCPPTVTPAVDYPVNKGRCCPKGWEILAPLTAPDRAATPYLKNDQGKLEAVDWEAAMEAFTDRFKRIQEKYGPESVAFISTGQIPTEEMALLGCLTKFGMGIVHGDGNTRQCMATAVVSYKQAFGFDAPPYTYRDLEESDVLVFVGANSFISHPILWERMRLNSNRPEVIVVDPRRTATARVASRHYAVKPKTDIALFNAVAHVLIENGWIDRKFIDEHTSGFEALREHLSRFAPEAVSKTTGLSQEAIVDLARTIHEGKRVSFWWTMGVNQSHIGVRTAQSIINCALLTGNIGRAGTGANSITGQCNAMGSRLFSNTTSLLAGYDFKNPEHRQKIAGILEIDPGLIPDTGSWSYDRIVDGIESETIKGLWIIATNSAHSWINQEHLRRLFGNLEFVVVQDLFTSTETAAFADLLLPAAGWGEKEGTFINSERRISRVRKVADPPGEALSDFDIFKLVADHWGCAELLKAWKDPEAAFQILKETSRGTPCDITGIADYAFLDANGGVQWPFAESDQLTSHERRLFTDGRFYHPDGRAKFLAGDVEPLPEQPDEEYPFLLITGRGSVSQFHTQTRTGKSAGLRNLYPETVYVEINPADADRLGIASGEPVGISSRRGAVQAATMVVDTVQPGQVFMAMHYPETNRLTFPAFDTYSRQPAYKACAVKIVPKRRKQ